MIVIPAILTNDLNELTDLLLKAEKGTDRVQIDVIDGKFVENSTIDPEVLKNISTFLNFDFHLMVSEPIDWIEKCRQGEKNRIIGQIENMKSQAEFVQKVKENKFMAGLAVDLETPIEKLEEKILPQVDLILLMSVKAGWGGQEFNLDVWDKIKKVVELRKKLNANFKISVDGGVTKELVMEMAGQGVDEVFVGRRIFEPDLKENLKLFNSGQEYGEN